MSAIFGATTDIGTAGLTALAAIGGMIAKLFVDHNVRNSARKRVIDAEEAAFKVPPDVRVAPAESIKPNGGGKSLGTKGEEEWISIEAVADRGIARPPYTPQTGYLFDLYSKQIELYQAETRARASWSFIFAIVAMFAGLGFVLFGGVYVVRNDGWEHVAAGTVISAIGSAVSAFITKTFLDVHRVSLLQLNSYFRQPVLNSHILTAQRLTDRMDGSEAKQRGYELILASVVGLINDKYEATLQAEDPKTRPQRRNHKSAKDADEPADKAGAN